MVGKGSAHLRFLLSTACAVSNPAIVLFDRRFLKPGSPPILTAELNGDLYLRYQLEIRDACGTHSPASTTVLLGAPGAPYRLPIVLLIFSTFAVLTTYMSLNKNYREILSALKDGELPAADTELALAMLGDSEGHATYSAYERISAVLRAAPSPELSKDFSARLHARLALELPYPRADTESESESGSESLPLSAGPLPGKA
jgi:hypothetical protein